jgi:hypothetical protein
VRIGLRAKDRQTRRAVVRGRRNQIAQCGEVLMRERLRDDQLRQGFSCLL